MFKRFFGWLKRVFASQQALLQLTIQSIVGELFKAKPRIKITVVAIIPELLASLNTLPAFSLDGFINRVKDKVMHDTSLLPPEQALVNTVLDNLKIALADFFAKQHLDSAEEEIAIVKTVLRWIMDMAR